MDIAHGKVDYEPVPSPPPRQQQQRTSLHTTTTNRYSEDSGPSTNHSSKSSDSTTTASQNSSSYVNPLGVHRPLPIPLVHPRHQQTLNCMKCAGFIRRREDGHPYGCRHTRVQTWNLRDILCYFSRMCEAFGGLHSRNTRYLFLDSLACTLAVKYKKRSRRAIYKKFNGLKAFPVPQAERPRRFHLDQPIPYLHECQRRRTKSSSSSFSCTEIDMQAPDYWTGKYGFYGTKKSLEPSRSRLYRQRLSHGQHQKRHARRRAWRQQRGPTSEPSPWYEFPTPS